MISTEEKKVRRGLGRGLSALFGEEERASSAQMNSGAVLGPLGPVPRPKTHPKSGK